MSKFKTLLGFSQNLQLLLIISLKTYRRVFIVMVNKIKDDKNQFSLFRFTLTL